MNLRDREPRKNDNDDNDDVVLKSKEPDESQATIENDREKVSVGNATSLSRVRY